MTKEGAARAAPAHSLHEPNPPPLTPTQAKNADSEAKAEAVCARTEAVCTADTGRMAAVHGARRAIANAVRRRAAAVQSLRTAQLDSCVPRWLE